MYTLGINAVYHDRAACLVKDGYDPYILLGEQGKEAEISLPLEPSAHPTPEQGDSVWDPLFRLSCRSAYDSLKRCLDCRRPCP